MSTTAIYRNAYPDDRPPVRRIPIAIISDIHLGTRNCQARPLLNYLYSVRPEKLVLLGDVFDILHKDRRFWPEEHTHVVRRILKLAAQGVEVSYVTGNHDAMLRQYSGMELANIALVDRLEWTLGGHRVLLLHGDIFDFGIGWPILRTIGGWSYDWLMAANRLFNKARAWFGLRPFSLSRFIKRNISKATTYIERYEATARSHARENGFQTVICGHIHQPRMMEPEASDDLVAYLNSGDWTEHCTALEWDGRAWHLHWEPQIMPNRSTTTVTVDEPGVAAAVSAA